MCLQVDKYHLGAESDVTSTPLFQSWSAVRRMGGLRSWSHRQLWVFFSVRTISQRMVGTDEPGEGDGESAWKDIVSTPHHGLTAG